MKHIKIISLIVAGACVLSILQSCKRDVPVKATTYGGINNQATIQFFSATVKATKNAIFLDGAPFSGSVFSLGGVFPATPYGAVVTPGYRQFIIKDTTPNTTQVPINFTIDMGAGENYTVFTYDTTTSIKQKTVLNNIVVPSDTTSRLRFANFIYKTTPLPAVDVYSSRRGNTIVFSNVATNSVTDFIPYAAGRLDTLSVYATGTTTPLITRIFVPSLVQTRSYTSVYTGSYLGTKVTSTFANY